MKNNKHKANCNLEEFQKIVDLFRNKNYDRALKYMEEYVEKYPKDSYGHYFYISCLIKIGNIEEAKEYIQNYQTKRAIHYKKFTLAWLNNDYETAYNLLPQVKIELKKGELPSDIRTSLYLAQIYLQKKLNCCEKETKNFYLASQIVHYKEEESFSHILKEYTNPNNKKTYFEPEIDIKELFYQIKNRLIEGAESYHDIVTDIYYFSYPQVENKIRKEGINNKYLKVITIHDTVDIISIFPFFCKNKITKINPLFLEEEIELDYQKVKRMSQIEKFEQKYGNTMKK